MVEQRISQWRLVDEGWGRCAADEATLHEPQNVREYVALHQLLRVGHGTRLLDIACGAGLAAELAAARGADVAAIDASHRLVAIARDRLPRADVQVGDMRELPWTDDSFDVVTSFRGIWGTTPEALDEARRVLRPGGLLGITVWGHIKVSPGAWALTPFTWADGAKVAHQAAMNSLGKPGAGEAVLAGHGFEAVRRVSVPSVWEFADPEQFARALACTGPAYEALETMGEPEFLDAARDLAAAHVRNGLPLRAEINMVGFVARKPQPIGAGAFVAEPGELNEAARAAYDDDRTELGYVMNHTRVWAHDAGALDGIFAVLNGVTERAGLSLRDRGILVAATTSTLGDSSCSLAWGTRLADAATPELSAGVLTGSDDGLDERERVLADWARRVTRDPNAATRRDVDRLRAVGYDDGQIHALTTYVALRIAFATVNDALGVSPDRQLVEQAPAAVRAAVGFGRAAAVEPSSP